MRSCLIELHGIFGMKSLSLVGVLALSVGACVAARSYRLPLEPAAARATFTPLAAVAGEMGYDPVEHPDSVNVRYDEVTWIQFMIQDPHTNMVIIVDDNAVPPSELERRFLDARAKGEEIWKRALASMQKTERGALPAAP